MISCQQGPAADHRRTGDRDHTARLSNVESDACDVSDREMDLLNVAVRNNETIPSTFWSRTRMQSRPTRYCRSCQQRCHAHRPQRRHDQRGPWEAYVGLETSGPLLLKEAARDAFVQPHRTGDGFEIHPPRDRRSRNHRRYLIRDGRLVNGQWAGGTQPADCLHFFLPPGGLHLSGLGTSLLVMTVYNQSK